MKKTLILILMSIAAITGCDKTTHLNDPSSEGARLSAEEFYKLLITGKTSEYVNNMQYATTMDSSMHHQMNDLMLQFLDEERRLRGGIISAKATSDTASDSTTIVVMELNYGNGTKENITLPLVFTRGRWYVK